MSLTEKIIKKQVSAMKSICFDIGVRSEDRDVMINRRSISLEDIVRMIGWLKYMNLQKNHIYIRPSKPHSLSLIDDINLSTIQKMKCDGYSPSVVIETSPGNYQVWLNHGKILKDEQGTSASKVLCGLFNADLSSADYYHYGRLAGFTNPKNKYCNLGVYPFSRLVEATGVVYMKSDYILERLISKREHEANPHLKAYQGNKNCIHQKHKTISEFHDDPRYDGDLHRADLAWASHAARHGVLMEEIERTLLNSRNLAHKGCYQRQLAYAHRTAIKAFSS